MWSGWRAAEMGDEFVTGGDRERGVRVRACGERGVWVRMRASVVEQKIDSLESDVSTWKIRGREA